MKINIEEALNANKVKKVAVALTSLSRRQTSVRGIVDRMKNGTEPSSKEILSLKKDIQDEVVMAFASEFGPEETMKKFKVVIDEAVEKIACLGCDAVSTKAAWQKNKNFCPKCKKSNKGVAESVAEAKEMIWKVSIEAGPHHTQRHDFRVKAKDEKEAKSRALYQAKSDLGRSGKYKVWSAKVISNEEVELDETSWEKDMDPKKKVIVDGVKGMKSRPFKKTFPNEAAYNRWADSPAAGDVTVDRVYQEEVELDEALDKMTDARVKYHATKDFPHGKYTSKEIKREHERRSRVVPNYHKVKPVLEQEETIDEGINKDHEIYKEYQGLMKMTTPQLRNLRQKIPRESGVAFKNKVHVAQAIVRHKHGDKKVNDVFGTHPDKKASTSKKMASMLKVNEASPMIADPKKKVIVAYASSYSTRDEKITFPNKAAYIKWTKSPAARDVTVNRVYQEETQKPYVSSDGKGNYEVLGNKGQSKGTFSRKEHGEKARDKARDHLKKNFKAFTKEKIAEQRGFKNKAVASKGGSTSGHNRWDDAYRKLNVELEQAKKAGDTKKVASIEKKKDAMMDKKYPIAEVKVPSNYAAMMIAKKKRAQKAAAKEKWGKDDAEYLKKNTQKEETDRKTFRDFKSTDQQ